MEHVEKPFNPLDVVWQGSSQGLKQAALTFDDGPDQQWTIQILNVLSHYNVKATFFCLGEMILQNQKVFELIVDAGHIIGNHTWDHPNLTKISQAEVRQQLERTSDIIHQTVGARPSLFRPPHGKFDEKAYREIVSLNYKIIQWTIDSEDYLGLTGSQITNNVLPRIQPGTIILQHCAAYDHHYSMAGTVEALETIIQTLNKEGYDIVTISEIANIPPYF